MHDIKTLLPLHVDFVSLFSQFCVTEFKFSIHYRFIYVTFNIRLVSLKGQVSGNVSRCVLLSVSKGIVSVGDTWNLLCCFSQLGQWSESSST